MRKVRILPLLVFACMAVGLTACGFFEIFNTGGGDPNDVSCDYVLKKHAQSLGLSLHLTCHYEKTCDADIFFGLVYDKGFEDDRCYGDYSYKFDDGKTKKTVKMNTTVPVTVDDDDHVRFSLFDSEKVEKTYDIDLSEIIHSYTVKDDSVEIKMPEGSQVNLYLKDSIVELFEQKIPEGLYSFSVSTPFDKYYYFDYSIVYETEMLSDVINVYGRIYWRE